jgi:hypothetical protein
MRNHSGRKFGGRQGAGKTALQMREGHFTVRRARCKPQAMKKLKIEPPLFLQEFSALNMHLAQ